MYCSGHFQVNFQEICVTRNKSDLSPECQKFVKKLFAFFSKVKAKKKEGVFPIAWSSKLGSVGQDFFFF